MPTFSIMVPCYNHGRYVTAALDSLIAQTCPDWEAIVVNDGSTDDTSQVLEVCASKDARIHVFEKTNGGCASAMNLALKHTGGRWLMWLSSDDTFEPTKLATHIDWFKRRPDVRFFHTHFNHRDLATGVVSSPPLWRRIPEERWQILEMLESTYIAPLSMCVHCSLFEEVGCFDERLRWAQDYDMMLRLLRVTRACFIDARTCSMGQHHAQVSATEGQTSIFIDAGKACLAFLNSCDFGDLFPLLDLNDQREGLMALDHAMDAAANPHAFLYKSGAHPALLWRILEWVVDPERGRLGPELRRFFCNRAEAAVRQYAGTNLGMFWSAGLATIRTSGKGVSRYRPVVPADVIETEAHQLRGRGVPEWETYAKYLSKFEGRTVVTDTAPRPGPVRTVTFALPEGSELTDRSMYGAMRMTVEMARQMVRAGRHAIVLGVSGEGAGWFLGVPCLGAKDDVSLKRLIRAFEGQDALVSIGRSDTLPWSRSPRLLVYHHTTHQIPGGVTPRVMNLIGARIVAVSRYSVGQLTGAGHRTGLVHLAPNAYDQDVFRMSDARREPWRILFVGNICQYKGFDIVLQAFRKIRAVEPRATLVACGEEKLPWRRDAIDHYMCPQWMNCDGTLNWNTIGTDIPGMEYRGHQEPLAVAGEMRRAGLLVMSSRQENFPLVSLEAQACGCWPILPRHLALPETIEDGETGSLYGPNTPEGLTAAILRLWGAELPSEGQRLGAAERVRKTFSFEKSGEVFMDVLDAVPELGWWSTTFRAGLYAVDAVRWRARRVWTHL